MTKCYCKVCKQQNEVLNRTINEKDILELLLSCGHKRYYLLITHSKDYTEVKNE